MRQTRTKLIGVFFIGLALMNFPIVELFSRAPRILGMPGVYFSIFMVWLGLILLVKHYTDPDRSKEVRAKKQSGS